MPFPFIILFMGKSATYIIILIIVTMINDITGDYVDDAIEIHGEVLNNDFDEVGWEPIEVDDSDENAAREYGY